MAFHVKMPKLGLTMSEGTIIKWLKKEGDYIKKGEILLEVESDKSSIEFESPESGYLKKILISEGDSVPILTDIAILGSKHEEIPDIEAANGSDTSNFIAEEEKTEKSEKEPADNTPLSQKRIFASPAAKRIARENNIDISLVPKRNSQVRIEKKDVLAFIKRTATKVTPLAKKIANSKELDLSTIESKEGQRIYSSDLKAMFEKKNDKEKRVAVVGMRKIIAKRMKESMRKAPHVFLTTEIDMSNVLDLKKQTKDQILDEYGVKISINDVIIKCTAAALKKNPRVNTVFEETEITIRNEINIGIAVALDEGLLVPVIRNADLKGLGEIAAETKMLTVKAKSGKLLPDEYSGGTFTVSNLGMYEITQFNSIINQPESAILSVAKIVERPVAENGQFVIKPIMNLTINFDHRPMDGAMAAKFLKDLKLMLEAPYKMLI